MDRFQFQKKMKRLKKWAADFNQQQKEVEEAQKRVRTMALNSSYTFGEALQAKGFDLLGSGAFGQVFGYPGSERVIKVIRNPETDGWLDYTHWAAQQGYAGKHAPQVFSYKLIKSQDKGHAVWGKYKTSSFGVAVMERLEKTVTHTEKNHDVRAIDSLFGHAMNDNSLAIKLLDTVDPSLSGFASKLKKEYGTHLDMHGGNVMLRKDGSYVVTDPVAQMTSKIATKRLKVKDFTSVALAA